MKLVLLFGFLIIGQEVSNGSPDTYLHHHYKLELIMTKTFSDEGIKVLEQLEAFRSKVYKDEGGKPTIGIGTLIDTEEEKKWLKKEITRDEAIILAKKHVKPLENIVNELVKVPLTQNQFDALICFLYNIPEHKFKTSTLLKSINENRGSEKIKSEFMRWVNVKKEVNGKVVAVKSPGLINRQKKQIELFFQHEKHLHGPVVVDVSKLRPTKETKPTTEKPS